MSSSMYFGVFSLVEGVMGITLNAFIILTNMIGLRSGSKLTPPDIIHVVMGMVNISLRGLLLGHFLGIWLSASYSIWFYVTASPVPFLMYYTFWLTAWLCTYYCTSITTSNNGLFTWMKRCLPSSLPHLLVSSGLVSLVISIPANWVLYVSFQGTSFGNGTFIITNVGIRSKSLVYIVMANLLGCCLPFILILFSLITSVSSLLRHIRNMKKNNLESIRHKLQSHINAIRTMVMLLMLSGLFYTAESILFNIESMGDVKIVVSWWVIIMFPTSEAVIMIQASQKLRKTFLGVFCPAKLMNGITNLATLNLKLNPAGFNSDPDHIHL
ncbi:taste receptor type 2 member 40-like [Hyla sarda]|uniref:taste receptor type 2 member 40-like n=1 Tax=Hyla sarda TaxID=327740 RepID=UPI0024C21E89|nr:taste receptor type 2 member 40-like [Hyla sarda]